MADPRSESTPTDETDAPSGTTAHYLSPDHETELAASGITREVARQNGVFTEVDAAEVGRLLNWKGPAKKLGDCLVFRFIAADGSDTGYVQVKPASPPPPKKKAERPKKYLCPMYAKSRAYIPVGTRRVLPDPLAPLILTEGCKKALCADAHGFPCVALVGVWNFAKERKVDKDGDPVGEKELIPDLAAIPWDGREVFICFDSDRATNGLIRAAEKQLAAILTNHNAKVKLVIIPQADDGSKQGIDDYIVANGADKFAELIADAKPVEEDTDTDPRPKVLCTANIHETLDTVRVVLAGVPFVYSRGGVLLELREKLSAIPPDAVAEMLSRHIRFYKRKFYADGSYEDQQIPPPANIANPVFARPGHPVREVKAVADHPLVLEDGRILTESGYDAQSGTLLILPDGFKMDPVPEYPTQADARAAAARLSDVFVDFPFTDEGDDDDPVADKKRGCHSASAVVAFMLTIVARQAIAGPVPMFIGTKNCPGTGGTLLFETCAVIVTGRPFDAATYPHENREMRLTLTIWAMEGRTVGFFDNLVGEIGSAELCLALTSTTRTDRVLGGSTSYSGPFTTIVAGTVNNARLAADMPRRVIPVRLETDLANPERKEKFKHDLSVYPLANRPRLLADLFIIFRAWQVANRPQADLPTLGKYEAWTSVVRQACVFAGLADPFMKTPASDSNRSRNIRSIALGIKAMDTSGKGMTAAAIVSRLTTPELGRCEAVQDAADAAAELLDRVTPTALGKILSHERNRNLGGFKIVEANTRDNRLNVAKWKVVDVVTPARQTKSPSETPATPANGGTNEQPPAGDAGVPNGVSDPPQKNNKRSGRVASNPHKGTILDKEAHA